MTPRFSLSRQVPKLAVAAAYLVALILVVVVGAFLTAFGAFLLLPILLATGVTHYFRCRRHRDHPVGWQTLLIGNTLVLLFLLSLAFLGFETRSEEHTSELQSRFGISYAVF